MYGSGVVTVLQWVPGRREYCIEVVVVPQSVAAFRLLLVVRLCVVYTKAIIETRVGKLVDVMRELAMPDNPP